MLRIFRKNSIFVKSHLLRMSLFFTTSPSDLCVCVYVCLHLCIGVIVCVLAIQLCTYICVCVFVCVLAIQLCTYIMCMCICVCISAGIINVSHFFLCVGVTSVSGGVCGVSLVQSHPPSRIR